MSEVVSVGVWLGVRVAEGVGSDERVDESERVPVGVSVLVGVPVAVDVPVEADDAVPDWLFVRVAAALELGDADLQTCCAGSSCATLQKTPGTPLT